MNFVTRLKNANCVKRKRFVDNLMRLLVLAAWFLICIGLYIATKDSPISHHMKAHSVDRVGLLPPFVKSEPALEARDLKGGNDVR